MELKVNDFVEIYPCIASLQPLVADYNKKGKPFLKKTNQQFGQITRIDFNRIFVRPKGRSWEIECYPGELRKMTIKEYKECKNYVRPKK